MNRKGIGIGIAVIAVAALVFVVVAVQKDNKDADGTHNAPSHTDISNSQRPDQSGDKNAAQITNAVEIKDFGYTPQKITVKKGTTVTWTNQDSVAHTVTKEGSSGPDSELFGKGESYSYTFDEVGTFDYYCAPHPSMKGQVVVTE